MHPVLFHIGYTVIPSYGAIAATGVLCALILALHTARKLQLDPNKIWNLSILMLFTALLSSRLLLIILNWTTLRQHPMWLLGLAMIHHPLLAVIGSLMSLAVAATYARIKHLPFRTTADALAAPAAVGLAFEQFGALLAGSGFGTGAHVPWAIIYTDPLSERWSGAPLGIPVHPVQAYAALCFTAIALGLMLWLPRRRQNGDLAGIFLMATGAVLFVSEFWRDPIGRGALFSGFLKGPQAAGIVFVIGGACLLLERASQQLSISTQSTRTAPPAQSEIERPSHG